MDEDLGLSVWWNTVVGIEAVAGQLRFNAATSTLQGDIDGNGVADLEIQLTGVASVAVGDFIL